ncbi:MAG: serine/threonine protein kinase [Candidatus Melainabacteria bacterium]|nr:serine/threonine protein kinase [Candidatus Melainabacteria bacterium]
MKENFKEEQRENLRKDRLVEAEEAPIASDLDSFIGTVIASHYEVLSRLGEGGMSVVYKAHHLLLDKPVALKFIKPGLITDDRAVRRFQQEARAASELSHPNVCSVRDFGILEGGQPYIVMDYLDGSSLQEIIETRGPLTPKEALELFFQACHGLSEAHARGVVHRDIKPGNMVMTKEKDGTGTLKIVDFGIARLAREDDTGPDLTSTGEIFGTPKYMSPEQCRGQKVDKRSDIYSLSCVLYEMLVGKPPFIAESSIELLMMHVSEAPALDQKNLPETLKSILYKGLSKDPEDRYQSISEMARDADRFLKGDSPSSLALYRQSRLRRWLNLKTGVASLLVIGIAALCLTVANPFLVQSPALVQSPEFARFIKDGDTAFDASLFPMAESSYRKALSIAGQDKDQVSGNKLKMDALSKLSKVYARTGQYKKKDEVDNQIRALLRSAVSGTIDVVQDRSDWYGALPKADSLPQAVDRAGKLSDKSREFLSFGDYKTAERLEQEVLDLQEKWLGASDPALPVTLNQLAVIKVTQGKIAEAKPLWQRALALGQKSLPESSPVMVTIWANNGRLAQHEGRNEDAERLFEKAIELAERHVGAGSESHLAALRDYSAFLNGTGRTSQAREIEARLAGLSRTR